MTNVALVGSPNSGKTTLFNALTGLHQRVANYAGVTVEHVVGEITADGRTLSLIDLPGTYSLEALSPDERVVSQVLEGRMPGCEPPDGIVVVADATTLQRSLQLVGDILRLGRPTVLIVTMIDELKARNGALKLPQLKRALGIPVVGVVGNRGIGMDDVRALLASVDTWTPTVVEVPEDQQARFVWADEIFEKCVVAPRREDGRTDQIDRVLLHPVMGIAIFAMVMFLFFQVVFAVAAPLQEAFESAVMLLGGVVGDLLPDGLLKQLLVDGVIAGVGGVVVFVPQIALLLLMIAVLEGSGYMARAAFVIDRVMGWAGLEGRCFIALLSSYACAIPGIMATRGVPDPRSRLATILVAPFMTCSARLPVYGLLIGAFIPSTYVLGVFNLQGIVLFLLYLLGSVSALLAAAVLKRGLLRGATYPFYMELPPYRVPTWSAIWHRVSRGVWAFLRKAGTVILAASVILWAALNLPRVDVPAELRDDPVAAQTYQLENSLAASVGHAMEPVLAPLGFDWRIGVGLVASLAAREVIVSTMAQIYGFGGDEEDVDGLAARMSQAKNPDGTSVYTLPTVLALLVFFVYALQCVSTLAVIRRETGSWKWPAFAFSYMLVIAYGMALFARYAAIGLGWT
ncbi:MAG: ferrous iron transporter B [bacterium]